MEVHTQMQRGITARVVIELDEEERNLMGGSTDDIVTEMATLMRAVISIRRGSWSPGDWPVTGIGPYAEAQIEATIANPKKMAAVGLNWMFTDLGRLGRRIDGVTSAGVREQWATGGSLGELGQQMEVPRGTAQSRRKAAIESAPTGWEQWVYAGRSIPQRDPDPTETQTPDEQ